MQKNNFVKFDFCRIKDFLTDNKEKIRTAALPLVIGVAVLFFWIYGADSDRKDISVSKSGDADYQTDSEKVLTQGQGSEETATGKIYVDISGAVKKSGVYEVEQGTRLFQVIEMAGGLESDADVYAINRAEEVYDGQKIIVGTLKDSDIGKTESESDTSFSGMTNGKVNINLADSATLQTIPGIGPSKAERIIEYRQSEGRFREIEDIKNITGIGDKTFESIKNYITV